MKMIMNLTVYICLFIVKVPLLSASSANCSCRNLYLQIYDSECTNDTSTSNSEINDTTAGKCLELFQNFCGEVTCGFIKGYCNTTIECNSNNSERDEKISSCTSIDCCSKSHEKIVDKFHKFKSILDKTVVNVSILEENRNCCLESYKRWICLTQYKFHDRDNNGTQCKPNLKVCNEVVQNCPYYTPARHQMLNGYKQEVVYGGLPAFMCPDEDSLDKHPTYVKDKGIVLNSTNSCNQN